MYIGPVGEHNSLYPGELDWISGDCVFVLLHDFEVTTWAVLKCNRELISVSVDTDRHQYFNRFLLAVGLIHT